MDDERYFYIDWGKIGMWILGIIFVLSMVVGGLGETGIFDLPENAYRQGDVVTYPVQSGTDEAGQPIYSQQPYECTSEKVVLFFWSKGCTSWKPLEQELSAQQVFEMVGKGYLGIASGSYAPIPGTGVWVGMLNMLRRIAWSMSVETGLAMGFIILVPTVIGGLIAAVIAIRFGPKTVMALGVPLGIFVLGSMTLHEGGRGLLSWIAFLAVVCFIVWIFRRFSRTRVVTSTGDVFDYTSVSGDPPQLPGSSNSGSGLRQS